MIEGLDPTTQALLATCFTWFVTAAGAGLVFFVPLSLAASTLRLILDASLGFAAGVMLAASYFSLLAPAVEEAETSGLYGEHGQYAFVPVVIGTLLGAIFVWAADYFIPEDNKEVMDVLVQNKHNKAKDSKKTHKVKADEDLLQQGTTTTSSEREREREREREHEHERTQSYRRMLLLVIAIIIHNFPEGLAVGTGFGALYDVEQPAASSLSAEELQEKKHELFTQARTLAFGIGFQNFPEGLAVSLPLLRVGFSRTTAFFWGQLSGAVEPLGGLLGAASVKLMRPILPYALSFAAGAMIFVVIEDIIPEIRTKGGYTQLANVFFMIGFCVMMAMDVGLG